MKSSSVSDDYAAAIEYLYGRINYEQVPAAPPRKLTLDNMRLLLQHLGNPHLRIPAIHVTGTKGKGSTSSMIASILSRAGFRTGLYTSPHLSSLEERYAIDGIVCPRDELVKLVEQIRPIVLRVDEEIQTQVPEAALTFFEITTAIGWLHFANHHVDIVVLEVGMGGRLDSTNLCNPVVTVITSISFDHTKQLGNTLTAIAGEKAGIIKPDVPVVSGVEQPEACQVIQEISNAANAPLLTFGNDFCVRQDSSSATGDSNRFEFEWRKTNQRLRDMQIGLLGDHQIRNAGVALAAVTCLQEKGWEIGADAIREGLAQARCPARIEVICRDPTIVIDTAHNVASIAALVKTLNQRFHARRRVLIFAASRDKDVSGMLRLVLPEFDEIIFTQFVTNPRAVTPQKLSWIAKQLINERLDSDRKNVLIVCENPLDAWNYYLEHHDPNDFLCVTGSFFLASELMPIIRKEMPGRLP